MSTQVTNLSIRNSQEWKNLTNEMEEVKGGIGNTVFNPIVLDLYGSKGFCARTWAVTPDLKFYDTETFNEGIITNPNYDNKISEYGFTVYWNNGGYRIYAMSNGTIYKIITSRMDNMKVEDGLIIDPAGTVVDPKKMEIINTYRGYTGYAIEISDNVPLSDYLIKSDDEFDYYSSNAEKAVHRNLPGIVLNEINGWCDVKFIKIPRNIPAGMLYTSSNKDQYCTLKAHTFDELAALSMVQLGELVGNYYDFLSYEAIDVLSKLFRTHMSDREPTKRWYKQDEAPKKVREINEDVPREPIVRVEGDSIVLITKPTPDKRKPVITQHQLGVFLEENASNIAKAGGIIAGSAAAYMINQKIAPPNDIDIWIRTESGLLRDLFVKGWYIVQTDRPQSRTISPKIYCIRSLANNLYKFKIQIIEVKCNPREIVKEFDLSAAMALWDPSSVVVKQTDGTTKREIVNFSATQQSVIDDILTMNSSFLERPWDLGYLNNPVYEQTIGLSDRAQSRLLKYMQKGFTIRINPNSIFDCEKIAKQINENKKFVPDQKINEIVFNGFYVYNVDEEHEKITESLIYLYERVREDEGWLFTLLNDILRKLKKDITHDHFNFHSLSLYDKEVESFEKKTEFKSVLFDIKTESE